MQAFVKRWRWIVLATGYLVLLMVGWLVGQQFFDVVAIDVRPGNEPMVHKLIISTVLVFFAASAIPFVPGAELGLGLLVVLGARLAPLVYGGMVSALLLAYLVGRLVPAPTIGAGLAFFGFSRARELVMQLAPLDGAMRLALLAERAPSRLVPFLLRHRHIGLMVLLNLPGNSVIGGGGGIALCAGMSRLFTLPGFLVAVMLAAAPVPIFFWFGMNTW